MVTRGQHDEKHYQKLPPMERQLDKGVEQEKKRSWREGGRKELNASVYQRKTGRQ